MAEAAAVVLCSSPTFARAAPQADDIIARAGARVVRVGRAEFERVELGAIPADTVGVIVGTERVGRAFYEVVPRLRVVAKHGAGTDNIDVHEATARGLVVTSAPGYNAIAVAEHTIGLMLAVARDVPRLDRAVRAGRWDVSIGAELAGGTLGIVGLGAIGRLVAVRARALDMRVLYTDVVSSTELGDATYVPLERLLQESDVVSLHLPLTAGTRHLIDAAALARMRPNAILVNAARGGLVDEVALLAALDEGTIRGAGLDVFEREPPNGDRLLQHERVVLTPHSAGYTWAALARTSIATATDVAAVLNGDEPVHRVG